LQDASHVDRIGYATTPGCKIAHDLADQLGNRPNWHPRIVVN
jgi:hypothetical protein